MMLRILICPAALFMGPISSGQAENRLSQAGDNPCLPAGVKISPEVRVLAVGSSKGSPLGWRIGLNEQDAGLVQVAVNSPGRPVFLVLGAYESTVWQIGWTEGTEIVGVTVTGYSLQAVAGLPPDIPLTVNSYSRGSKCPKFSGDDSQNQAEAVRLIGTAPEQLITGYSRVAVGDPLLPSQVILTSGPLRRADYDLGWPEEKALLEAIRQGRLKPASARDFIQWRAAAGDTSAVIKIPPMLTARWPRWTTSAYLVTDPDCRAPVLTSSDQMSSLYDPRTYVLFLPPGCRPPEEPAYNTIYLRLDNGACSGRECPPNLGHWSGQGYE